MRFKRLLKTLGKNLLALVGGGVIGIIVSVLYFFVVWFPLNVDKMGLAVVVLLPVMIILFSVMGIFFGGVLGVVVYQVVKLIRK